MHDILAALVFISVLCLAIFSVGMTIALAVTLGQKLYDKINE